MKPGSSLNPNAASFIPLSERGVAAEPTSYALTENDSKTGTQPAWMGHQRAPGVIEPSPNQQFPQNNVSASQGSSSQTRYEIAENQVMDDNCDKDLAYLQMTFPDISDDSLSNVFMATNGDLKAIVDMINGLEKKRLGSELLVRQVTVGGFDNQVSAKTVVDYFEGEIGHIWRCRLKTSSTPPGSYPDFTVNPADVKRECDYVKVEPHAFLHFVHPYSPNESEEAANEKKLKIGKKILKVNLEKYPPYRLNQLRRDKLPVKLTDVIVECGLMASQDQLYVGWRGPKEGVDFVVDPFDGTCKFLFTRDTAFSLEGTANHAIIKCEFKVVFLVSNINKIIEFESSSHNIIQLQLASSPLIYYRTADDDIEVTQIIRLFDLLDDVDPWVRTTDFTPSGAIGRCNTYRISVRPRAGMKLKKAMNYLKERKVPIDPPEKPIKVQNEPDFEAPMSNYFFCHCNTGISFNITFMLNAVLHKCIINQHQLSDSFYVLLKSQPEVITVAALRHIYYYRRPLYDACKTLKEAQEWLGRNPKLVERHIPRQHVEVRRLIITPTKAYCVPPEVELSNRVIRFFNADKFLRVTFMDEGMQTLDKQVINFYPPHIVKHLTGNSDPQNTTLYKTVNDILSNGFNLCGRRYSFLLSSPNQMRERSAWFFAEDKYTSCAKIIDWMGSFNDMNVAKCTARMGQCFSSTYAASHVPSNEVDFQYPDVVRKGYVFSDGIGKISPDLAKYVAERLNLQEVPCAYQIRYAGYKGVVACWPSEDQDHKQLYLRKSMNKFDSSHTILEVCSWTKFQPAFLNRQIITLLSALNVKDEVFEKMQEDEISKLNKAAVDILTESCAEQGKTASIMLSAGFNPETEPYLRGMLTSVKAVQLRDLREKARIFVPLGRQLMGCLDERGVLQQGQCYIQVSNRPLKNRFAKQGSKFSETERSFEVIKGRVAIAKNPCLHPGDVRILEAVDAPELNHLYDCLVFPKNGDRPHANEASGSDLDGDLYFVTWDPNLVPPESYPPMEYAAPEIKKLTREVNHSDIVNFFTEFMMTENVGAICNAHVVYADMKAKGAQDEDCIELARLAALAVDFPKTGKVVDLPPRLKPIRYPDFMEKGYQSYKSEKVLGKLYRRVKAVESFLHTFSFKNIQYDEDLELSGSSSYIKDAWTMKCLYDGEVKGLLGKLKVNKVEEVLRKKFRPRFEDLGPHTNSLSVEVKNIMYEEKASAWYKVTYHCDWVHKGSELQKLGSGESVLMLGFAWIAADYLASIKKKKNMQVIDHNKRRSGKEPIM